MDVSKQVDSIVQNLVKDIETRLNDKVEKIINDALTTRLENFDYEAKLNWLASLKLDSMIAGIEINKTSIEKRIDSVADVVVNNVEAECKRLATEHVRTRLYNDIDVNALVRDLVKAEISKKLDNFEFPERSIPAKSINTKGLTITGDQIVSGVIPKFASTGIEDHSSNVQMTLIDEGVVVENKLVTLGLEVKGTTVLEGNLVIHGDVPPHSKFYTSLVDNTVVAVKNTLDAEFFSSYASVVFDQIRTDGLDLDRITLKGVPVIEGGKLNYGISDTNITRLGLVRDLQTVGEALISENLYVSKTRVGVNTIEPGHALSIWDQEVEIGVGKRQRDTGWIGTPRAQALILGVGDHDNIVLQPDGSISVTQINIKNMAFITTVGMPKENFPKGTVAFNEAPSPGQPVGWVSLGNSVWSKFGIIG